MDKNNKILNEFIEENYISKDKIKAKIEELDKYITECEYMDHEEWLQAVAKIHFLQHLFEEE